MGRGGKNKVTTEIKYTWIDSVADFLVGFALKISPKYKAIKEQQCIKEYVFNKEESLTKTCLLKTFSVLNTSLGREEKAKKETKNDTLSDLAFKVCAMAELAGGLYVASEIKRTQTKDLLNEALDPFRKELKSKNKGDASLPTEPSRDDIQAAIDTTFRIKLLKIVNDSLDRQAKERTKELNTRPGIVVVV